MGHRLAQTTPMPQMTEERIRLVPIRRTITPQTTTLTLVAVVAMKPSSSSPSPTTLMTPLANKINPRNRQIEFLKVRHKWSAVCQSRN